MVNRNLRRALGATLQAVMLCVCGAMLAGCRGNNADRLEQAFRDAGTSKATVAPVAGVVTIDGIVPEPFTLVMLWDPKKPEAGVLRAICDSEGRFAFTSYDRGDGVPPGTYVVLFARLNMGGRLGNFDGPDLLNNLYNDPDKNAADPEFQITVSEPGKSDYHFNLGIAGKPSATPGPHAVTELRAAT
jgi:hypothetical protein